MPGVQGCEAYLPNLAILVAGNQPQAEMAYNGLGQRLTTTAYSGGQDVTTQYVVDIACNGQPLMATAGGQTEFYLHGLGPPAGYATDWSYYLADGTRTIRQVADAQAEITLSRRMTPWGTTLAQNGEGSLAWGLGNFTRA